MKGLDDWRIADIKANKGKKSAMELAKIHNCHYRTVENYWREETTSKPECEESGISIKVITIVPGKTLNFIGVTKIDKGRDWVRILKDNEVIGLLEPQNITAIVPI